MIKTSLCSATSYADNVALPAFVCHAAVHHAAIDWYLSPAGRGQATVAHGVQYRQTDVDSANNKANHTKYVQGRAVQGLTSRRFL